MTSTSSHAIRADSLHSLVQKIEKLEEEKSSIAEMIKEVYLEAKAQGFEPKILKQVVRLRKKDPSELSEEDALLELYRGALNI